MSDELRLPDELAATEARLASQSPTPSALNRDELMYRAGWAAAEAAWVRATPLSPARPLGVIAAWSATSAAVAASLAIAVTLSLMPRTEPSRNSEGPGAQLPIALVETGAANDADIRTASSISPAPAWRLERLVDGFSAPNGRPLTASPLLSKRSTHWGDWEEPILVTRTSGGASAATTSQPVTVGGMWGELLPTDRNSRSPAQDTNLAPGLQELLAPLRGAWEAI